MRKALVFLVLLLSAGCLLAQDNPGKTKSTIQGCLSSSADYRYYLTDSSGTKHELSGDANKLKNNVGHEVAITGVDSVKTTDTSQPGMASSVRERIVFRVMAIKSVANTCTTK